MAALLLLLLLLLAAAAGVGGTTVPAERDALLALGDPCERIAASGGDQRTAQRRFFAANRLDTDECVPWVADSDPCADGWSGVVCDRATAADGTDVVVELQLQYSKLVTLPANFSDLAHLEAASLQYNSLSDFPESLPQSLRQLHLTKNAVRSIPDSWQNLRIEKLELDDNRLESIPEWFGRPGLPLTESLWELDLDHNLLSDLPPDFCHVRAWAGGAAADEAASEGEFVLDLDHNNFIEIPACLASCTGLTGLELGSNGLRSIPAFIANLTRLRYLKLFNNNIRDLPEQIGQLVRLTSFDLGEQKKEKKRMLSVFQSNFLPRVFVPSLCLDK
jgi:hypothetical protein